MTTITLTDGPTAPSTRNTVILPIAFSPPADPVADFVRLLTADPRQERPQLTICPTLQQAAIWRAHQLAQVGEPWGHTDSAGRTPNERVRAAGCALPDSYGQRGNNVESLAAGTADAAIIFASLANSPKHSDHLFGRGWFAHQRHVGVAVAEGGEFGWYWCVLIGVCMESSGE